MGSLVVGKRFFDDKLGVMLSASVQDNKMGSDNIEAEWEQDDDGTIYTSTLETQSYEAEIARQNKQGSSDVNYARKEDQRTINTTLGGDHQFGKLNMKWHGTYAKASEDRPDERYIGYKVEGVEYIPDLSNPRKPNYTIENAMYADFSEEYEFDELT